MSRATYIARTRFQTLGNDGAVLYTTYGARIYDDYESAYVNQLDNLDELMALDPDELIDHIRENNTAAGDIIDMAKYCDIPLYVDDELHSGGEENDETYDDSSDNMLDETDDKSRAGRSAEDVTEQSGHYSK